MKPLLHLFVLLGILIFWDGCTSEPPKTLRVGSVLWPGYEPLYLARNLGYYDGHKIQLVDYLSNTDALYAFKNNALEASAFTLDETLQLIAEGVELEIILVMDISHGGDAILANPQITSFSGLKGKRIGVETGAVGAYVLSRALELNGLSMEEIIPVPTLISEQLDAFNNKQIDAAVTFDPERTELLKVGKIPLFDSSQIPNEIVDILVVHKAYAQKHPDIVTHLLKGWFQALEYNRAHPYKAAEYAAVRQKMTTQEFIEGQALMHFPDPQENVRLLDPDASPLKETAKKLSVVLKAIGMKISNSDLGSYLNPDYSRKSQE